MSASSFARYKIRFTNHNHLRPMLRTNISVHELQIGMYVAKLDLAWFRSPFLRHSFLIERTSQIERLVRAGVKTVEIDLSRGVAAPSGLCSARPAPTEEPYAGRMPSAEPRPVKSLAQLTEEYAQAKLA